MSPLLPHIEALASSTFEETVEVRRLFEVSREEPERMAAALDAWLAAKLGLVGSEAVEIPWFEQLVGRWRGSGRHAFEAAGSALSYDDLHQATARRARAWRAQGVKQGSRVCVCRPFGVHYVVDLLAGFLMGACVCWVPSLGEPYERRAVRAFEGDFVSADRGALARLGADDTGVPLAEEARPEVLAETEGPVRYARQEPCLGVLSPKAGVEDPVGGEGPSWEPTWLDCESLQRAVARDAALVWLLRPGDQVAAPGFDDARHQPALLLACLLTGATYHLVTPGEVAKRSPRLQRKWRALGVCRATLEHVALPPARVSELRAGELRVSELRAGELGVSESRVSADIWFRDLEEEWDAELRLQLGRSFDGAPPLLCGVLTDPALGSVVLATGRSLDVYDNTARVALGVGFELTFPEGAAPDAGSGALRLTTGAASPDVILSELRWTRFRYLGSSRPRRQGAVYPREVVAEAVSTLPGVIGAAVVDVPRGGERPGFSFGLVVFVRGAVDWGGEPQRLVRRRIEGFLREVLAPELRPDFVECHPLRPRRNEDGVVDAGWVTLQRLRGRLRQKAELRVFRELSSLGEGVA